MWPRSTVALTQTTQGKQRRCKTGGFLRASTLHTFCFVSHLVLLHFLGSAVGDVPEKALLRCGRGGRALVGCSCAPEKRRGRTTKVRQQWGAGEGSTQHPLMSWQKKQCVFTLRAAPPLCPHWSVCPTLSDGAPLSKRTSDVATLISTCDADFRVLS